MAIPSKGCRLRRSAGQFPAPLKVGGPNGRAVRWLRVEVEEWIGNLERTCNA